ncbi:hypothetical protein MMC07_005586 [Pseudocyphellaria aurata]|nr:hypothetical protein [Pseudocyphellaria aurata]
MCAPAQDSDSSALAIPLSDLQRSRGVDTSSSSSQSSSHGSGPSTPDSSSSTASTLQTTKTVPPTTTPLLFNPPSRLTDEYSQPSTPAPSSYAPSPSQAAQDDFEKPEMGSMPTQSHLDPSSNILEPSAQSKNLADTDEENSATLSGVLSSIPEVVSECPEANSQSTRTSMMQNWMSQRSWLQNTMGSTMLAVTLIGLFVYQRRSYRIAIWTANNDFMQSCLALNQANRTLSDQCERVISDGVGEAPYTKRGLYSAGVSTYKLTKRIVALMERETSLGWKESGLEEVASTSTSGVFNTTMTSFSIRTSPTSTHSSDLLQLFIQNPIGMAIWNDESQTISTSIQYLLLFTLPLVILGLLLFWLVSRSRTEPVITSQAHTEVKVTRHYSEGAETTDSDGPLRFTRDYPGDNHPLGQIRRRLVRGRDQKERRDSMDQKSYSSTFEPNNDSTSTLVGSWTGSEISKVSITTSHDDKNHEGLLELRSTDSTRHFLDPNTGEFIHLTPWKSIPDGGDKDSTSRAKLKHGDIGHAVAKLGVGSAAFSSKQVDWETLAREKKKRSKGLKGIKDEGEKKLTKEIKEIKEKKDAKDKAPPRAGDCINLTNEAPTAMPVSVL